MEFGGMAMAADKKTENGSLYEWVQAVVCSVLAAVLLAANAGFLAVLLFARHKWKAMGKLDKAYIDGFQGWKRYVLLAVKLLLTAGVIWELLVVLVCAGLLIVQPWNAVLP